MTGASAKTESSVLSDKINEMSQSLLEGNPLVEWDWQCLHRDIINLEKIPEFRRESLTLQFFVHALKRDIRKVEAAITKYVAIYGKDFFWYRNRAMLGIPLGRADFVFEYLDFGYTLDDLEELLSVFDLTSQLGLMLSAEVAFDRLVRLGMSPDKLLESSINREVLAAAEFYRNNGVNEREVAKHVAKASFVVAEANGFINRYSLHTLSDGVLYNFTARGKAEELLDLEGRIVDVLHESFDDDLSDYISFAVISV
jgi:hypothetical protein